MKSKLNNWATTVRVFWGIVAGLAALGGIILATQTGDFMWIVYCGLGAAATIITSFALAALLNGVATLTTDDQEDTEDVAPAEGETPAAPAAQTVDDENWTFCPQCGKKQLADHAACLSCGATLKPKPAAQKPDTPKPVDTKHPDY